MCQLCIRLHFHWTDIKNPLINDFFMCFSHASFVEDKMKLIIVLGYPRTVLNIVAKFVL